MGGGISRTQQVSHVESDVITQHRSRLPKIKLSHSTPLVLSPELNRNHDQAKDPLTMSQILSPIISPLLSTSIAISTPAKSFCPSECKDADETDTKSTNQSNSATSSSSSTTTSPPYRNVPSDDTTVSQMKQRTSLPPVKTHAMKSSRSDAGPGNVPVNSSAEIGSSVKRSLDDPYTMPEGYVRGGQAARLPENEEERVAALLSYGVLDTPAEEGFDSLARLAAEICGTPIALISFVDSNRQWFKARVGIDATETNRASAFCSHAILDAKNVFQVPDSTKDARFADNPLVKSAPYVRFYAGMPIYDESTGSALGTVCAIDHQPRKLNDFQTRALKTLAQQCMAQLELKKRIQHLTLALSQLHETKCALKIAKDLAEANQIKAEKARAEAEEANKHKSVFLSHISHEIRTPLNAQIGMTWLLQNTSMTDEQSDYVQHIQSSGEHLLIILNDLLDYSKFDAGHLQLDLHPVCPISMIEQAINLTYRPQTHSAIDVFYNVHNGCPPTIRADSTRLRQVLINCLSNAFKFTADMPCGGSAPSSHPQTLISSKRGQVWIELEPSGELGSDGHPCVKFSVHDSGIGMSPESISKLFTPFSQVHDRRKHAHVGGTGLGLAISQRLVAGMGGKFGVTSTLGSGSTFYFTISTPKYFAHESPHNLENLAAKESLLLTPGAFDVCMLPKPRSGCRHRMIFVNSNSFQTQGFVAQFARWGIDLLEAKNEETLTRLICQPDIRRDLCAIIVNQVFESTTESVRISQLVKQLETKSVSHDMNAVLSPDQTKLIPAVNPSDSDIAFPSLPIIFLIPASIADAAELGRINAACAATVRHPVMFSQLKQVIENVLCSVECEEVITISSKHSGANSRRLSASNLVDPGVSQQICINRQSAHSLTVSQPVAPSSAVKHPPASAPGKKPIFEHLATSYPLKLLVVDDNHVNVKLLTRMLTNLGYTDFQTAVDGLQAKEIMVDQQQQYDLVLIDMMMPRMNGVECVQAVLGHYRSSWPHLTEPVFCAMTASAMASDQTACLEAGMQEFVSKPINPGRLQEVIKKLGTQILSQRAVAAKLDVAKL